MDLGLEGRVAVVTGGGGVICGEIARGLAEEGVSLGVLDISLPAAEKICDRIRAGGGKALALQCDATEPASADQAVEAVLQTFGNIDVLVNGAGGGRKEATTGPDLEFFDIDLESIEKTIALNYLSALVPSQRIGRLFASEGRGVILNISSVSAIRPLTRAIAYSNAKAALQSFTQWLAVHMAKEYSSEIRVNAIAPGFLLTEQNRFLLVDEATGEMTERGRQIISHVPMGRYGRPDEILGAALWLVSDQASFVTGSVVVVDGGFTAYPGV